MKNISLLVFAIAALLMFVFSANAQQLPKGVRMLDNRNQADQAKIGEVTSRLRSGECVRAQCRDTGGRWQVGQPRSVTDERRRCLRACESIRPQGSRPTRRRRGVGEAESDEVIGSQSMSIPS